MAYLKFHNTGDIEYLSAYHTIGRRKNEVSTELNFPFISKLHVVIEWKGLNWMIKDMSSNGTWLNGERLTSYNSYALSKGDIIEVAGDEGVKLEFTDDSKPEDMIYRVDQKLEIQSLSENCLLPNQHSPIVELYKCPERHEWFAQRIDQEHDILSELGPFDHNSELVCGDQVWRFYLEVDATQTVAIESSKYDIADIEFRFDLSQDEESTTLTLIHGSKEVDLQERTHHYLLAHLLRHKHAQQASNDDNTADMGWMSCLALSKDLGLDEKHMNIQIFRARQQISKALLGYSGSSRLFERRRGAIRTGISNYSIHKASRREI